MTKKNTARSARAYQQARAELLADPSQTRCVICGGWVDKSLPYRDPVTGKVDGRSASAEHVIPLSHGGPLLHGLSLSHLACNVSQGSHVRRAKDTANRVKALQAPDRHF